MINKILKPLLVRIPENNRLERIWKLAQVDFKKRYNNDRLGLIWALLNPILRVSVYYWVFTYVFARAIEGIDNYALFLFSGLIFWMFFTEGSRKSIKLLYTKSYLIKNIQFQKIDIYISHGLSVLLGFIFNLSAFVLVAVAIGVSFSLHILYLPVLIFTLYFLALGVGMIISILFIYIKDINHILDVLYLFGFWSSGVMFKGEKLLELFPPFLYLNPIVGVMINARKILIYNEEPLYYLLVHDLIYGIILFFIGTYLIKNFSYRAYERI